MLFIFLGSCKSPGIIDKPINFEEDRIDLTLEYMQDRYGLDRKSPEIDPKMIVLYWTAIPTLEDSFQAFKSSKLPQSREAISGASQLNVSAHFLVARDGTIYRLMPETMMARHVIGLNHTAIGVENVGGTKDTPLTNAQLKSNIWLVNYLSGKYDIQYVIGHYEYTNFEDHELWLEKDSGYRTEKVDPGEDFMKAVRDATQNRNFRKVPSK
ncbi:peptidoglycan recognition family protein [Gramella sp. MAR_2010_147]|uniref:N-acetylmuramoyl-L-alanine amidase n=1 Tax=Gramella sp. MAR_2010_147 TaxID=1250205 RepID=UPI00087BD602|nr:peptidoglycan recognition family protein [Gramella sp. MAR_2010_147]SDS59506.1 N-acetylmuramoyl-L-alanine amidase [Gramella sp. MAR_2010_147]